MPNGDCGTLVIKGIKLTSLPDDNEIPTRKIGRSNNEYLYTLDTNDIPKAGRYITIEVIVSDH